MCKTKKGNESISVRQTIKNYKALESKKQSNYSYKVYHKKWRR